MEKDERKLNKYFITPIKQRLYSLFLDQEKIDKWMQGWKFFFILGFGRSGTAFMANLLNNSSNAYVFHEPVLEDFLAHAHVHRNPRNAYRYIFEFRKKEIFSRMHHISSGIYGEVNSLIRCHAEYLASTFPDAVMIHLIRDGRDVIRSTFGRSAMTLKNPFSLSIRPANSDPWKLTWHKMDRFARICWFWQEENKRLRNSLGRTVQLEKILTSYEYFSSKVLEPCGIHIEQATWDLAVKKPLNTTNDFAMPRWEDWSASQQSTFREICGEEMKKNGYFF